MEYQEIKTNRVRNVISFSFFFITFFGGEIYFTKEFCGFVIIRQERIKYRYSYFNEWFYQNEWMPWKYHWITLKIE